MENIVMDIFLSSNRGLHDSSEDSSSADDEALFLEMLGTFERQRRVKIQGFVENIIPQLMDNGFQGHFRLTREHVELFLQELEIPVPPTQRPGRSRRSPLNRLLLTLWFLANRECYRSTAERFNVTVSILLITTSMRC
nr:PREDICTED: uncharacterized protein LOC109035410 [Bemisia tabaci]